jgi:hypothetical protein
MREPLNNLFAIGKRMQIALASDDMEAFGALLQERQRIIESLDSSASPLERGEHPDLLEALATQDRLLGEALAQKEEEMMQTLRDLDQLRKADRTYRAMQPQQRFLKSDIRG